MLCFCAQDLCTQRDWLDQIFARHAYLKSLINQQLAMLDRAPAPDDKRDPIGSLLTLRERLFRYHHAQEPEDLSGLNTFEVPPDDILSSSKPRQRHATLTSLLSADFKSFAWPSPELDDIQAMARRLISMERKGQLPAGQELTIAVEDQLQKPMEAPGGGSGTQSSPAGPASAASKPPQTPTVFALRDQRPWETHAEATAAAKNVSGKDGHSAVMSSLSKALHGDGEGPRFTSSIDANGSRVGYLQPAKSDCDCTPEQTQGWCEAMMQAHANGDVAWAQELSRGGPPKFKPSPKSAVPVPQAASAAPNAKLPAATKLPRPGLSVSGLCKAFFDRAKQKNPDSSAAPVPAQAASSRADQELRATIPPKPVTSTLHSQRHHVADAGDDITDVAEKQSDRLSNGNKERKQHTVQGKGISKQPSRVDAEAVRRAEEAADALLMEVEQEQEAQQKKKAKSKAKKASRAKQQMASASAVQTASPLAADGIQTSDNGESVFTQEFLCLMRACSCGAQRVMQANAESSRRPHDVRLSLLTMKIYQAFMRRCFVMKG